MILWILISLFLIGLIGCMYCYFSGYGYEIEILFQALTTLTGIILGFILIVMVFDYGTVETQKMKLADERYNIEKQIDSCNIKDDILFKTIKNYNADIIDGKYYQRNFWIGNMLPNIYDEFEPIKYDDIKCD